MVNKCVLIGLQARRKPRKEAPRKEEEENRRQNLKLFE
jgi:hypothetical protein